MPRWLDHALKDKGIHEKPGPEANARIIELNSHTRLAAKSDETSWCSSGMCGWFEEVGIPSPHSAAAIDWETWGVPCELRVGAVVVLKRKDPNNPRARHVTLCHALLNKDTFQGYGGNQKDQCKDSTFSVKEITAIRWPKGEPLV
jgi:uncharacterized protein (TIGR02594 family)